jgi:hypothetical protein
MIKLEVFIIISVWVLSILIMFFIPAAKRRIAHLAFLFKQAITWSVGLPVVEYHLLEYPIRCLADVNRTSITYEFMAFPAACALFNAYYPQQRGKFFRLFYYVAFTSVLTVIEVLLEKYTEVIKYVHWSGWWTFVTIWITFMMTRAFCVWFFRLKPRAQHE